MGVIADFASVRPDVWPAVLPAIKAAGVVIEDEAQERGGYLYLCARGSVRVTLAYFPDDRGREVCMSCPAWRAWRRPWSMYRLMRDVWRAILSTGASHTPYSGPVREG
jgi:hypothetical protein